MISLILSVSSVILVHRSENSKGSFISPEYLLSFVIWGDVGVVNVANELFNVCDGGDEGGRTAGASGMDNALAETERFKPGCVSRRV